MKRALCDKLRILILIVQMQWEPFKEWGDIMMFVFQKILSDKEKGYGVIVNVEKR